MACHELLHCVRSCIRSSELPSVAYGMDGMAPTPLRACRRACSVGAAGLEFGSPLSEESAQSYSNHSTRNKRRGSRGATRGTQSQRLTSGVSLEAHPGVVHSIAWHSVEVLAVRGFCSVSREYVTPHFTARPRRMAASGGRRTAQREERGRESDSESHNVVRRAGSR